eukprot:g1745.t1
MKILIQLLLFLFIKETSSNFRIEPISDTVPKTKVLPIIWRSGWHCNKLDVVYDGARDKRGVVTDFSQWLKKRKLGVYDKSLRTAAHAVCRKRWDRGESVARLIESEVDEIATRVGLKERERKIFKRDWFRKTLRRDVTERDRKRFDEIQEVRRQRKIKNKLLKEEQLKKIEEMLKRLESKKNQKQDELILSPSEFAEIGFMNKQVERAKRMAERGGEEVGNDPKFVSILKDWIHIIDEKMKKENEESPTANEEVSTPLVSDSSSDNSSNEGPVADNSSTDSSHDKLSQDNKSSDKTEAPAAKVNAPTEVKAANRATHFGRMKGSVKSRAQKTKAGAMKAGAAAKKRIKAKAAGKSVAANAGKAVGTLQAAPVAAVNKSGDDDDYSDIKSLFST